MGHEGMDGGGTGPDRGEADRGGRVVPFPRQRLRPVERPELRLAAALAALEAALAEQRAAVGRFRAALATLGATVNALEGRTLGLASRLGVLQRQVGTVHRAARDLEAWADRILAAR